MVKIETLAGNLVEHLPAILPQALQELPIKEIYTLGWLNDARPLLLIGQTGVGKTFIAQAIGLHACASSKSVLYMSITALLENLAIARSSGTYLRYRDKLAKFDLVIFDEMGMRHFTATEAHDLCEIIDERSINKSIAFTSQLPVDHWNEVIPDAVIFDAIRDRLEHSALTIKITGQTYRGVKARNLLQRKRTRKTLKPRLRRQPMQGGSIYPKPGGSITRNRAPKAMSIRLHTLPGPGYSAKSGHDKNDRKSPEA